MKNALALTTAACFSIISLADCIPIEENEIEVESKHLSGGIVIQDDQYLGEDGILQAVIGQRPYDIGI